LTNQQLYLAIGIPSVLVILSWLSNNTRLGHVENRMDRIEDSISSLRKEIFEEFKQFYRTIGQHDADIESLKKAGK
jgi:hypothetical protein